MSTFSVPSSATWLVVVSFLWGLTNPWLKRTSSGIEQVQTHNSSSASLFSRLIYQFLFLIRRWQFLAAFLANQSGSLLFYLTLASADLSLAVPITNSLTLVFTALSGRFLFGEDPISARSQLGIALILLGVTLCATSKAWSTNYQPMRKYRCNCVFVVSQC